MAVTKLQIYNGACLLLGQRLLLTDTEEQEIRYDLDALYAAESGLDYCLEAVKPKFALKLDQITGTAATQETAYTYQIALPTDYLAMEGLYYDGKLQQPIKQFYREGAVLLTDVQSPFLRYVQAFATIGLTNMTVSFSRVVSAYFARELCTKYDPDLYESLNEELSSRIDIQINLEKNEDSDQRPLDPTVLDGDWLAIYNDIMNIYGLPLLASVNDDSERKRRIDQTRTSELVEACLEDILWHFPTETVQMNYDPSIEPEYGYQNAFAKPTDIHRIDGLFIDEYFRHPLKEYTEEYDANTDTTYFYCSYQTIYLKYISSDFVTDTTLWPAYFKRFVASQMAYDAFPGVRATHPEMVVDLDHVTKVRETRRNEAKSTDAMSAPPRLISRGSWSSSRRSNLGRRDRP